MGNLPVVHEVTTAFQSLGDAITGDLDGAAGRWETYAEQSVIGSGIYSAVEAARGNEDRAIELAKGMGRATGSALLGGGLLRNLPVFHELATAGDSLGDVIGGGNTKDAEKRWEDYAENSVIGSGVYAAVEAGKGNMKRAEELGKNMGKAALSAGVTTVAVGATIATGGAAAPLGAAAAAGIGAAVGAGVGAGAAAAEQKIRGVNIKAGDVVGSALIGGVGGAVGGAMAGRAAAAADVANLAEVDAVAAQMAAGEIHPGIIADIRAAEAAGAAEMAAMEEAAAGEAAVSRAAAAADVANLAEVDAAAAQMAAGEIHPGVIENIRAAEAAGTAEMAAVEPAGAGQANVSRAGSVASRASSSFVSVESANSFISADSTILYFEQGNNLARGRNSFNFNDGRAARDARFNDVWRPRRPGNQLDARAAHEGARLDAQAKANALSRRQQPGMIAVVQDEAGNAFGGHSVRGANNQGQFAGRLSNCHRSVLHRIPDGNRGVGHGNCAEQVVTQNVRHVQYKQSQNVPQLFTGGRNRVTAYRRAPGAQEYNMETPACPTCRITNQFFGFEDGAGPQ